LAVLEVGWEGIWPIYTGLQRVSGGSKKKKKKEEEEKRRQTKFSMPKENKRLTSCVCNAARLQGGFQ
jgi:hypothetical protein